MTGEQHLRQLANIVLANCPADQVEVAIYSGTSALTRFANNYIHQNVEETNTDVRVRAVIGKKIGIAATDIATDAGLVAIAQRAVLLARLQAENPDFVSLPGPAPIIAVDAFSPRTAAFSAEERAEVVSDIVSVSRAAALVAAGAFRTAHGETAIANSLGAWAYHRETTADANVVVMGETASGHAEALDVDVSRIDGRGLVTDAIEDCRRAASPLPLDPGTYEVVLDEYAVADIIDYFADLAFGSQAFIEKRSFLAGRIGEKVLGENVTIWDDGLSLAGLPAPFDAEGVPRQRVNLISNGIGRNVVWDSYYGNIAGHPSTGHALPAGETLGPAPGNLFLAPGEATKDEMIESVRRGVYVSRFWYTRPVRPLDVTVTGMTRDGTFLIEDGRITGAVHNLRFTQSYVEAMKGVDLIGRETKLLPSFFGCCRVPALKLAAWNFTGATV